MKKNFRPLRASAASRCKDLRSLRERRKCCRVLLKVVLPHMVSTVQHEPEESNASRVLPIPQPPQSGGMIVQFSNELDPVGSSEVRSFFIRK